MNYAPYPVLPVLLILIGGVAANLGLAAPPAGPCTAEVEQFCQDVKPVTRRQLDSCLRSHVEELSAVCSASLPVNTLLAQMSDYLQETRQFSFEAEFTEEDVLDSGQKLQFEGTIRLLLRRPDKFRIDVAWARGDRRLWYDGTTLTLEDRRENVYASIKAPETIDQTLTFAQEHLGVLVPLTDLLSDDPYDSFLPPEQAINAAFYLGLEPVRGYSSHHLAVSLENLDWQIWIENEQALVPRKLVLTYKNEPSHPQYTVAFTHWNLSPRLPDALFQFIVPDRAEEIAFMEIKEPTTKATETKPPETKTPEAKDTETKNIETKTPK